MITILNILRANEMSREVFYNVDVLDYARTITIYYVYRLCLDILSKIPTENKFIIRADPP